MPVTAHDFVGRRAEMETIEDTICGSGLQIVCIHGAGGIGKTSILREVARQYANTGKIAVTHIIDFYKPGTHTAMGLVQSIARNFEQIEEGAFEPFYGAYRDLEKMSAAGVSLVRLNAVEKEVEQEFFACYSSVAQKLRLVILIDTMEMVQTASVTSWLIDNLSRFDNTFLLLAGRRNDELYESIVRLIDDEQVQLLLLQPFDPVETQELFAISDVGTSLPMEVQEKVQILSGGHPILLTLALDWRRRLVPSEELTPIVARHTVAELRSMDDNTLESVWVQFEQELVEGLTVADPESQLLIYMAYVHRRFNAEILAFLQDIDEAEAQAKIDNIRNYSFVKYFEDSGECYLHDEMRRLVLQYVCRAIDRGWEQRTEFAQKIAELCNEERYATRLLFEGEQLETDPTRFSYYGKKLWDINKSLVRLLERRDGLDAQDELARLQSMRRVMEAERVYYWFMADRNTGLALYREAFIDNVWTQQRDAYELKQAERNLAVADLSWKYPSYELLFEQALVALLSESDRDTFLEILDGIDLRSFTTQKEISRITFVCHCWTYRSFAYASFDLNQALRSAKATIESLHKDIDDGGHWLLDLALARAYNALGYANVGAERYAQSVEAYQKSVYYNKNSNAVIPYADTLNDLSYVYGLLDQCLTARPLCNLGLSIRQRLGQDYSVGLSYNTLGQIYLFENYLDMAQAKCEIALDIFERLGEPWGLGLSHKALARVMNVLAERSITESRYTPAGLERERTLKLIQRGLKHAKNAEESFRISKSVARLAEVHQTMASLHRMKANVTPDDSERSKYIEVAHALYAQAQGEYEDSGIYLEQAFLLERWSRVHFDQQDYQGWMQRIKQVEQIAIQQTGDLRTHNDISSLERQEFLHIWGKIERAYGIAAWLQRDLESVAMHFTMACAFLEEYSDQSQTYRDTLDALTDILGGLSASELDLINSKIASIRQQRGLQDYMGIIERMKAATGIKHIVEGI